MVGLTEGEKNRRKRERKKKEKEDRRKAVEVEKAEAKSSGQDQNGRAGNGDGNVDPSGDEIEIEYVAEDPLLNFASLGNAAGTAKASANKSAAPSLPDGLPPLPGQDNQEQPADGEPDDHEDSIENVLRRFQERAAVVPSSAVVSDDGKDDEDGRNEGDSDSDDEDDDEDGTRKSISKRKLRGLIRPSVADLKRRVKRPDLVEAHDVTAADPEFLIALKAIPGTTPVPRHWGRKRKYLQGKRGFEKPPFQLPDFITKTGIAEIRDTIADDEAKQSAKQKNRSRVNPKMGAMDVDYKVLHEAFFKYQTKPKGLTGFGDLYYEGKELETSTDIIPGAPYSRTLREAMGMYSNNSPPPWLLNMQRYGPPPSYPHLSIPGLNAPLPDDQCQYGYHTGGWGKPPVDPFGRPLYGGNPFDPPGSGKRDDSSTRDLVTSDGKTVAKASWGSLPLGDLFAAGAALGDGSESEEEESSSDDESMGDSNGEGDDAVGVTDGMESVLPPPASMSGTAPNDLRKQPAGDETPAPDAPRQLYQVLEAKTASEGEGKQEGVFKSDVQYVVPGGAAAAGTTMAAPVPDGAESVLSKAMAPAGGSTSRKRKLDGDDDDDAFDKNFKF